MRCQMWRLQRDFAAYKSFLLVMQNALIIFDYSGTLSLGGPAFARPEHLRQELKVSGLWDLGIKTPEIFWEQIVNPTWEEGSTTPIGYKKIIYRQVKKLFPQMSSTLSDERIFQAASLFVDRYLEQSRIDAKWRPLLQSLSRKVGLCLVIATDHYAEATGAILHFLQTWEIPATSLATSPDAILPGRVIVSNSADLGVHKADRRFWEILCKQLETDRLRHILLIDDFGVNEQHDDLYAGLQKVENRRQQTIVLLKAVFQADVQEFYFRIKLDLPLSSADQLMDEASRVIDRFLDCL
jgi:hypothetical protein